MRVHGFKIKDALHGDVVAVVVYWGLMSPARPWSGARLPIPAELADARVLDLPRFATARDLADHLGMEELEGQPGAWTRKAVQE